jgi:hypothetical protein
MYTEKALFLPMHEVITDIVIYKSLERRKNLLENLKNVEEIMFYPDKKTIGGGSYQLPLFVSYNLCQFYFHY